MATRPNPEDHRSRHWLSDMPYRALVHVKDQNGTPLYLVAGSNVSERGALKSLKEALRLHGGCCFYCDEPATTLSPKLNIDHVDASAQGGCDLLHNLVVACRDCNQTKRTLPVEAFKANAGRRWLLGVQALIRARLALLPEDDADS